MLAYPSPKQWSLARRASCSPACLASVCASLSIIPLAFATAMHALNGSVVFYGLALLHAGVIWSCFFRHARHALDGDIVTLQGHTLVIESARGRDTHTRRIDARWAVLLVAQTGARTRLSLRFAGETLELGRFATQSGRLRFLADFQQVARCEMNALAH
ncbi:DUF2244 domain-containing protein [Caballeronia sp. GAFFF1]|uniref:DUF2244 domain-containing protein n=1 Tax=Caballeronia sp. GAFFF1 TaxID=2921779 RepID=UPI002028D647|nr:DUF2244 domain-containing protein [Caballeronia sp. GAFFF1]